MKRPPNPSLPVETDLELPAESISRPDFRRFIKYIEKYPWYGGYEGRTVYFRFKDQQAAQIFLKELTAMFEKRNVQTTNAA